MAHLSWQVGEVTITRIVEMQGTGPLGGAESPLPEAFPEVLREIKWLIPHFCNEEGFVHFSVHALLLDTPHGRLIVDTCVGNDKARTMPFWDRLSTGFLSDLESIGWTRESVDGVLCTHLHVDHVGWNTMLENDRWVPTFPNARYYFARNEFEHWRKEAGRDDLEPEHGPRAMMDSQATFLDSVKPIIDAGLEALVEMDATIFPCVRLIPTPGHSPGHVSVLVESQGKSAVITGDLMHHPCQIARPQWSAAFDSDQQESQATRYAFFARFCDTPTRVIGTHFGGPTAGYLRADGDGYWLQADLPDGD